MSRAGFDAEKLAKPGRLYLAMTKASDHLGTTARTSITRGLDFIYRVASTVDSYGSLSICCFALVGATSRDANLRQLARSRAEKLAQHWHRAHPFVPPDISPELVPGFILVRYALSRIGLKDAALKAQIRTAAERFSAQELLGFDPVSEPPASDLPYQCDCGLRNQRGRTF